MFSIFVSQKQKLFFFSFLPFLPGYSVFIIPFSVYGIPFSGYVNNFHIFCLCDCISVYVNNFLCYFNVTFQELFSTLSTASTSGSVRLRIENFQIRVFVILKSENGNFHSHFFSRIRTLIWQKYFRPSTAVATFFHDP